MFTVMVTAALLAFAADPETRPLVIVVVGAEGTPEYGEQFRTWADRWEAAASQAGAQLVRLGDNADEQTADRQRLEAQLAEAAGSPQRTTWLVLIGHGTFDTQQAKFNLRGPDVTAQELAGWLKPIEGPLAVINCASASGPFINHLSGPGRIVVAATKSGAEHNFARFGQYMSEAIADTSLDLDKDGQTSLLEAYLAASSRTAEFYDQHQRLATEHALLDDNGDSLGTPADWFRGFRAVRSASEGAAVDGQRAARLVLVPSTAEAAMTEEQRQRRDQLESEIEALRGNKQELGEPAYYQQLEELLVQLARLYQEIDAK